VNSGRSAEGADPIAPLVTLTSAMSTTTTSATHDETPVSITTTTNGDAKAPSGDETELSIGREDIIKREDKDKG
jgi:hypothetical protein